MAALFSCFVDACDARRLASIRFANKGRSEADRISDERRDSVPRGQLRLPNQNPFDSSATAATCPWKTTAATGYAVVLRWQLSPLVADAASRRSISTPRRGVSGRDSAAQPSCRPNAEGLGFPLVTSLKQDASVPISPVTMFFATHVVRRAVARRCQWCDVVCASSAALVALTGYSVCVS
jgi:hypothetical protein